MKKYNLILAILLITTMVSCVNPDTYETPANLGVCGELTANKAVQDITSVSNGITTKYVADDIIEAYVTSSDLGGNFYKSISLVSVDGTVGFSMPIDDYNLYTKYEPGRKVFINMKNRYFNKQYGSTVIGSLYNNDTPSDPGDDKVGRISGAEYQSILTASCSSYVKEETLLNKLTVAQAKSDANLNKLIELDNVQFTDESLGKKFYDTSLFTIGGATNHQIIDPNGSSVIVRISQYATFANEAIPSGSGKIVGVMTKYNSDYQFMIRTINDVKLTRNRIVPFFEESFSSNFPNWEKRSISGAQVWSLDTQYGNPGSCAKMTGYANSTNNANEDWLISPVQNMSAITSATLSFDTATKFSGNPIVALISNNYNGLGNPASATWTTLTATLSPSTGNYVWTGSGAINISSFTGVGNSAVYIAFKYTSTTSASSTWEVDNVKITAN
jgi:hypothetical protein